MEMPPSGRVDRAPKVVLSSCLMPSVLKTMPPCNTDSAAKDPLMLARAVLLTR